jgi:hypothetical protein
MAQMPKPPGARRRRNAGQSQWIQLPSQGRNGATPVLPGEEWTDSTRAWWATIWRSPMATAWQDADHDSLVRLAHLREDFMLGELPVSALGAMQQLEDRFGLSPKSRRALQWEIGQGEERDALRTKPAQVRTLRAVDAPTAPREGLP